MNRMPRLLRRVLPLDALLLAVLITSLLLSLAAHAAGVANPAPAPAAAAAAIDAAHAQPGAGAPVAGKFGGDWGMLQQYCNKCHNSVDWAGGVAFDAMSADDIGGDAKIWEEAVNKLRGSLMPPPGNPQPDAATRDRFIGAMEHYLDVHASAHPQPGHMVLHRLNRTEYANAVKDLLGVEVDGATLLPRDDKSGDFDDVAEVLKISPSFLEQYFSAARQVTVAAVGNPQVRPQDAFYSGPPEAQQYQYIHLEGLPLGTRGGMLISHDFPADGDYEFTVNGLVGAGYLWGELERNTLIITIDDRKVFGASLGGREDLDAVDLKQAQAITAINNRFKDIKVHVPAGRHRVGITFLETSAAESNEILNMFTPVAGVGQPVNGVSTGPRIANVEIKGPLAVAGGVHPVSQTESRRRIFTCYPKSAAEELPCAKQIFTRIATRAFRRPVTDEDLAGALQFYAQGRKDGADFDGGVQKGLLAILVSPKFLYRMHTPPADAVPGKPFRIGDIDLASRLSFFLWGGPPDDELIKVAAAGQLHQQLDAQVKRMLADPRAHSLVTGFAFDWLNIRGLELVEPDPNLFPEYTADLQGALEKEMELFIGSIFDQDRSVVDLLTSDTTFLNERLALHYHISGVRGGQFRAVKLAQSYRRGLLGKGALLMATSYANRTSPVVRGSYLLEKLFGTPVDAPPPGVPGFPETQEGGKVLTVRARLEAHRAQPSCNGCHGVMDPVGYALENFNALGQWRDKDIDAGLAIDATDTMADGTVLHGVDDLRNLLVARAPQFVNAFTEHLMTYALGRTLDYSDMPVVRGIVRDAARSHYRFSDIVLGIVHSDAFQTDQIPVAKPQAATKTAALIK